MTDSTNNPAEIRAALERDQEAEDQALNIPTNAAELPALSREDATKLADRHAGTSLENHQYLDDRRCDRTWKPHAWVIDAVVDAYRLGSRAALAADPAVEDKARRLYAAEGMANNLRHELSAARECIGKWVSFGGDVMGAVGVKVLSPTLALAEIKRLAAQSQQEPVTDDWQHLKAYGYAPGGYMSRCHKCGDTPVMDKRAITCRQCAEVLYAYAQQEQAAQPAVAVGTDRQNEVPDKKYWQEISQIGMREWAIERWRAEVANRPLANVHRRSLDDAWRQVLRFAGGDPDELLGPSHDALLARPAASGKETP